MKHHYIVVKFLFSIIVIALSYTPIVMAQNTSTDDLGVSKALVLPTNPFYFLKEFQRNAQKVLTFNSTKKLELELKVVNEKLSEIMRLQNFSVQNADAINKAVENYSKELEVLAEQFFVAQNSQIDNTFLNNFIINSIKRAENVIEIKAGISEKVVAKIDKILDIESDLCSLALIKLNNNQQASDNILSAIKWSEKGLVKDLASFAALNILESKLSGELKDLVIYISGDLMIKVESLIKEENFTENFQHAFNVLNISGADEMRIIDILRELTNNSETKNSFVAIRQDILDKFEIDRVIRKSDAENMINELSAEVDNLNVSVKITKLKINAVNSLLSRAQFNLKQAQESFNYENYSQAFSQASSAFAAARVARYEIIKFMPNNEILSLENTVKNMKEKFDVISNRAKELNYDEDGQPLFFELSFAAEKSLVLFSDLINKNAKVDTILDNFKRAKILLFRLDDILN